MEKVYPAKPGDWLERDEVPGEVAKVKQIYVYDDEVIVDLYFYNRYGERLPRQSPAMGGPTSYEPACPFKGWHRISEPEFPITLVWIDVEDGRRTAEYSSGGDRLPDREWVRPPARRRGGRSFVGGNYDPQLEASARRMAAQEMRDAARKSGVPDLAKGLPSSRMKLTASPRASGADR